MAKRIRKERAGIRALYMSGYPAEIMRKHGHLPKGIRVLSKPFSIQLLARHVRGELDA